MARSASIRAGPIGRPARGAACAVGGPRKKWKAIVNPPRAGVVQGCGRRKGPAVRLSRHRGRVAMWEDWLEEVRNDPTVVDPVRVRAGDDRADGAIRQAARRAEADQDAGRLTLRDYADYRGWVQR